MKPSDILIVGGGNAALCAAMTAAEAGASVRVLEGAPKPYRGGNSRHTRNFRCMHQGPLSVLTDSYDEEEYFDDLLKVTGGKTNEGLARPAIRSSQECLPWMEKHGVWFQPSLSGTLSLARTNAFFHGGGKALVNAYYRTAQSLGVDVRYEAQVTHLELDGDRISRVEYSYEGASCVEQPKAVIVASGGFQADTDWLTRAWGPAAKNFLIRGTPYNRGVVLRETVDEFNAACTVGTFHPTELDGLTTQGWNPQRRTGHAPSSPHRSTDTASARASPSLTSV